MAMKMMAAMTAVLVILVASLPHIVYLLCLVAGLFTRKNVPYAPFGWTALALAVSLVIVMAYGVFIGRWKLVTNEIEYENRDIPASFDGYKIVHISDFHLSTFEDRPSKLAAFVDAINAADADLVCFTGDLVSLRIDELAIGESELARISARDGVVSVLGNHDFFLYSVSDSVKRARALETLVEFQREKLGWRLLRNENLVIRRGKDKITVIGVDNTSCKDQGFETIAKGDLGKAADGTDGFRIALTHDPSHWTGEIVPKTDIQLTLSGHTHAAQIRLLGWTPASWLFNQTDGRYDIGNQTLHINIGLGCTVPMRLGANPEITIIRLIGGTN